MRNGLVEGVSLRAVLRESGAMAPEAAASVLAGMLVTLAGVHGDVRPEHVQVDGSGGLALTGFSGPEPGFVPGVPTYLAPERVTGGAATPEADVFSVTAVFFECLTNEPPFRAASREDLLALHEYAEIVAEFAPPELRRLAQRGLAPLPANRPARPYDFLKEVTATAEAAYGADWQVRGRALLGNWAAAAARAEGTELTAPPGMPEPPPVGEPIDERLLGLGAEPVDEALLGADEVVEVAEVAEEKVAAADDGAGKGEYDWFGSAETDGEGEVEPLAETAVAATDEPARMTDPYMPGDERESDGEIGTLLGTGSLDDLVADVFGEKPVETPVAQTESVGEIGTLLGTSALDDDLSAEPLASLLPEPRADSPEETEPETDLPESGSEPEPESLADTEAAPGTTAADPEDDDWVFPAKPGPKAPRSLSAYALSLPSMPRPKAEPEEPKVPVQTSAPDDWFRPGVAGPVAAGSPHTEVLNPDRDNTAEHEATRMLDEVPAALAPVRAAEAADDRDDADDAHEAHDADGGDDGYDAPAGEAAGPGGPRRKTLVGAVTTAVLLVAGAAAVVLGGTGKAAQSPAGTPTESASPVSPSPTGMPTTPSSSVSSSDTASSSSPSYHHSSTHSRSHSPSPTPHSSTETTARSSSPSGTATDHSSASSNPSSGATSPSSSCFTPILGLPNCGPTSSASSSN